jgi:hypothetical protein
MDDDVTRVKLEIYRHFAEGGQQPSTASVAAAVSSTPAEVKKAYAALRAQRLLWLEADGETIRMAPPFSGVPTKHSVIVEGRSYFANCAWDSFGVVAALRNAGVVMSSCAQSGADLRLRVGADGPEPSDWIFHCLVPAAHWWDDLVFT